MINIVSQRQVQCQQAKTNCSALWEMALALDRVNCNSFRYVFWRLKRPSASCTQLDTLSVQAEENIQVRSTRLATGPKFSTPQMSLETVAPLPYEWLLVIE